MSSLSTPLLLVVFAVAGVVTWLAGIRLSSATDTLDRRLNLGEALGGVILLAIAGSLPELAITVSAAASGDLGLASGNLIGGVAVQTLVLVICDAAVRGDRPLSYLAGSLLPVFEALLVVVTVSVTVAGGLLRPSVGLGGVVSPASIVIVVLWAGGLVVLNRARKEQPWRAEAPASHPGRRSRREAHPTAPPPHADASTARVAAIFGLASVLTLGAGVVLADGGNELANRAGINGVIFGATILALVTALPEISSGLAAVRLGDYQLTFGDIFGGNAFQVCLFLVADLVAGRPVLPHQGAANSWLGGLGIVLTAVYGAGIIARPSRRIGRLGVDSIAVVVLYALGVVGLVAVSQ
ncbi:MAG TPA: sodium:calcium antiporter [Mycobacteriales bacterium]|nr:sodium:calcium antiporter [Mycobacteriales bacterium]